MTEPTGDTGGAPTPAPTGATGASPTPTPQQSHPAAPPPRITPDTTPAPAEKPQTPPGEFTGDEPGWAPGAYARFRESRQQYQDLKAQMEEVSAKMAERDEVLQVMAPIYRQYREAQEQERLARMEPEERIAEQRRAEIEAIKREFDSRLNEREAMLKTNVDKLMMRQARQELASQYPEFLTNETLQNALIELVGPALDQVGPDVVGGVEKVLAGTKHIRSLIQMGKEQAFNSSREHGDLGVERGGLPPSPPPEIPDLPDRPTKDQIKDRMFAKYRNWLATTGGR